MKLKIIRKYKKSNYTIGNLYVDGVFLCNTLEDADRGLSLSMSLKLIQSLKVKKETAIPKGIYRVTLNVVSPRFGKFPFYQTNANGGRLPRLLNVPGYEGVLIHVGDGPNGHTHTEGCVLIGHNKIKGGLLNGKECFIKLYKLLQGQSNIELSIE